MKLNSSRSSFLGFGGEEMLPNAFLSPTALHKSGTHNFGSSSMQSTTFILLFRARGHELSEEFHPPWWPPIYRAEIAAKAG